MACGHCRRPRKKDCGIIFDHFFLSRTLSSSFESRRSVRNAWKIENGARTRFLVYLNLTWAPHCDPCASQALPAPSASAQTRAGCSGSHTPSGSPGGATHSFSPPAPLPQNSKTSPTTSLPPYSFPSTLPRTPDLRGRRIRDGLRPLPPTPGSEVASEHDFGAPKCRRRPPGTSWSHRTDPPHPPMALPRAPMHET